MGRPVIYGEAMRLAVEEGKTAGELIAMGTPAPTAYRIQRLARYGAITAGRTPPRSSIAPGQPGKPLDTISRAAIGTPTRKSPVVGNDPELMEKYLRAAGTMIVNTDEGIDAESIALTTRAQRLPMPVLLGPAIAASKEKWDWPSMNVRDFIDTIIYQFFFERGVILGAYYTFEEMDEMVQLIKDNPKNGNGHNEETPLTTPVESSPIIMSSQASNIKAPTIEELCELKNRLGDAQRLKDALNKKERENNSGSGDEPTRGDRNASTTSPHTPGDNDGGNGSKEEGGAGGTKDPISEGAGGQSRSQSIEIRDGGVGEHGTPGGSGESRIKEIGEDREFGWALRQHPGE